jgi:membrane protein insertase Oxa1/YidC/SpoIIIJ
MVVYFKSILWRSLLKHVQLIVDGFVDSWFLVLPSFVLYFPACFIYGVFFFFFFLIKKQRKNFVLNLGAVMEARFES